MNQRWMIPLFACVLMIAGMARETWAGAARLADIGGSYAVPVMHFKEVKFQSTLRQQFDFSCGSAALATLLTYHYRFPVSEQVIFREMFAKGDQQKIRREGFSLLDMKRYLDARGFAADGFLEPLDKLEKAQLPAIALINEKGYYHFVVIKGMRDGRMLIGDPTFGTRTMARENFETMWVNRVLFLIHNRRDEARFNLDADWSNAPQAPLADAVRRWDLFNLPKRGISDF